MDLKVSKKETVWQPDGTATEVLVDNVFDIFPVYTDSTKSVVKDVEILDDDDAELLDRGMFALIKQRGQDPLDLESGVQWAEAVLGEVPAALILQQVSESVGEEGRGVQATAESVNVKGKQRLQFTVNLVKEKKEIANDE